VELPPRVKDRITRDFGARASEVEELLTGLNLGQGSPEGTERIVGAILIIAKGDVDRLILAASEAEMDWRDVLVWAGLENEDWRERLDGALAPAGE
jgi:hypothetical protein